MMSLFSQHQHHPDTTFFVCVPSEEYCVIGQVFEGFGDHALLKTREYHNL